ncbi:MAG: carboxypeptidase regulatory-like domain-containing protein [Gemmatimonadales bacterium]|nr:MAG: carboxypeptidase regulatory-like domain-containing protein [Gemmatimonadales bacterium]
MTTLHADLRTRWTLLVSLLIILGVLIGCEGSGPGQLIDTDRSGIIDVEVFADLNRSRTFDGGDSPIGNAWVALRFPGAADTIQRLTTNSVGEVRFSDVPVGVIELLLDPEPLGDSLVVSHQTPDPLRLIRGQSEVVRLGVSYPIVKIDTARGSRQDRPVFVEGVALNGSGALPNSAIHLWDGTGWLRAEATTGPTIEVGDSVRVRGRVHRTGESVVLREGLRARIPGRNPDVTPVPVTTREAREAGASLDAALVRIETAGVVQTVFQGGVATVQISDGSGTLMVQIPQGHLLAGNLPIPRAGGTVQLTGLLVPQAGGTSWMLRTRSGSDVNISSTGTMTGRVFIPAPDDEDDEEGEPVRFQDTPLAGVTVQARAAQIGGQPIGEAVTGSDGTFQIFGLPTGAYEVDLDPFTYPDSLTIGTIEPTPTLILTNQTTHVTVPLLPPAEG